MMSIGTCRTTALAILMTVVGFGQESRGVIAGRVADTSDGSVVGVEVKATNRETGIVTTAVSGEGGGFRLPFLTPGIYRVTAEYVGFKKVSMDSVEVRVGETLDLPVRLAPGNASETVEVTGAAPLLETGTSSMGTVMDQRRIQELPMRGGNPMELTRLSPQVSNLTNLRAMKASSPSGTSQMSVAGSSRFNTEFQIDGITNTTADLGDGRLRVAFIPPASAISEFRLEVSPYDASFGHTSGATVNISTKSGTNDLHGDLRYWFRNAALDASNWFENRNGTKPAVYQDNRYGVSAGGPIWIPRVYHGRNRTFWFYAYEGNQWGRPTSTTNTVPTLAQRNGDFSALLAIPQGTRYQVFNPFSTRAVAGGRFQRDPFPGNLIPRSMLDGVGQNLVNLWPAPNQAGRNDGANNHYYVDVRKQEYNTHMGRFDHEFREGHRLFFRMHNYDWISGQDRYGSPQGRFNTRSARKGMGLDDVKILSPTMVLNVRYGLTYGDMGEVRDTSGIDLTSLGFSKGLASLVDPARATVPRVRAGAFSPLSEWNNGDGANSSFTHTVLANLTQVRGPHSLRYGVDARLYRGFGTRTPLANSPDLNYTTAYTRGPLDNAAASPIGQELAAMLLGVPDGQMDRTATNAIQDKYIAGFLQDDWRVNSRLTLNMGVRYEYEAPVTERFDRLVAGYNFDTANPIEAQARANYAAAPLPELAASAFRTTGGLSFVNQNGSGRSPYKGEKNNVLVRAGLAYKVGANAVIRAGYGTYFDSIGVNRITAQQTGFSQSTPIQASLDNGVTYVANNANPFPQGLIAARGAAGGLTTSLGQGFTFYDPNLKHAYSQRWSFSAQQMLPGQTLFEVGYVGSRGTRLASLRNLNATPIGALSTSPVRDQARIDSLSQTFASPFFGLAPSYGRTITRANLLRPYPHFGNLNAQVPDGYSWYHSMQVRAERRMRGGLSVQTSYVWSKFMEALDYLNDADLKPYETISDTDRPHRITASGIWEIPVGKGRQFGGGLPKFVDFFAGSWQLNGVWIMQSGPALGFGNALFNGDIKAVALAGEQRSVERWFNSDGFVRDAARQLQQNYRQFPLRFSGIRGDGQRAWDWSLFKTFPVTERAKLQFRAELYNAFNQASFNAPNTSPVSGAFGTVTDTGSEAKNWQFSLFLKF
ncbi:MAG: carboxypeptidase-like regulatory domain-containing protein [Acidobacteria bacterium]|nr:carboxypeptidase-like regulatory domain-containing protein [Acidobacteriota bacterium]